MNEATIRLHVEKLAGGRFLATSADVPGLVAEGRSIAEAAEIAQGLARKIAESCIEHGDPLPPALSQLVEGCGSFSSTFQRRSASGTENCLARRRRG